MRHDAGMTWPRGTTIRVGDPEQCSVAPRIRRSWWRFWESDTPRSYRATMRLVEVEHDDPDGNGRQRLARVRMTRRTARAVGLRVGAVIVRDRDAQAPAPKQRCGLETRFARVLAVSRNATDCTASVDWIEYAGYARAQKVYADRPVIHKPEVTE